MAFDVGRRGSGLQFVADAVQLDAGDVFRLSVLMETDNDVTIESQSFNSTVGLLTNPSIELNITAISFYTE